MRRCYSPCTLVMKAAPCYGETAKQLASTLSNTKVWILEKAAVCFSGALNKQSSISCSTWESVSSLKMLGGRWGKT